MNLNADISRDSFLNFYEDNKAYIVPIVAILVSVLLLFLVIIPQLFAIPQKKSVFDQEQEKVNKLKEYKDMVTSADQSELDSQIQSVSAVLPPEKNFESALNAILGSANNTNTLIDNYEFQTDVLAGTEDARQFPQLRFTVEILADAPQVVNYINDLAVTAPISEVQEITSKGDKTKLTITFFYKPFPPVGFEERTAAQPLNVDELKLFDTVSDWSRPLAAVELEDIPTDFAGE